MNAFVMLFVPRFILANGVLVKTVTTVAGIESIILTTPYWVRFRRRVCRTVNVIVSDRF